MKRFYSDCVGWPMADVRDGLMAMVDGGRQITRGTFLRHVDWGGCRDHLLACVVRDSGYQGADLLIHATARHRCEAFLMVMGEGKA